MCILLKLEIEEHRTFFFSARFYMWLNKCELVLIRSDFLFFWCGFIYMCLLIIGSCVRKNISSIYNKNEMVDIMLFRVLYLYILKSIAIAIDIDNSRNKHESVGA